jgi:hypothetical protein
VTTREVEQEARFSDEAPARRFATTGSAQTL